MVLNIVLIKILGNIIVNNLFYIIMYKINNLDNITIIDLPIEVIKLIFDFYFEED